MTIRAAILTVSDQGAAGRRVDTAGPAVATLLASIGAEAVETAILPDDRQQIAARLTRWADDLRVDLILTTGGTGLSPRDLTPEATLDVAERLALSRRRRHARAHADRQPAGQRTRRPREPGIDT
jgi:molybdenum cofactor synthesis domain-containing protein